MSNPLTSTAAFPYQEIADPITPKAALTPLSWSPRFPDFVLSAARAAEFHDHFYLPAIFTWGLDSGKSPWLPIYPDFPARQSPPLDAESLTSFAYTPAISRWGLDAIPWTPIYPDFARAAEEGNLRSGRYSFVPDLGSFPLPNPHTWSATWPDFPGAKAASPVAEGGQDFWNPTLIQVPAPALSWHPEYDDFARGPEEGNLRVGRYSFVPDLGSFPLPAPTPWIPDYPDFARSPTPLPAEDLTSVAYSPVPGGWGIDNGKSPWRPTYPDFPARSAVPLNAESLTTFSYVPALRQWGTDKGQMPWLPDFPDYIWVAPDGNRWLGVFSFRPDSPSFVDYEAFLLFDPTKYTQRKQPKVYLEAIMSVTGGTASARLYNMDDGVVLVGSTISTASATAVRIRSAALTMPAAATQFKVQVGASTGSTVTIRSARLIVDS